MNATVHQIAGHERWISLDEYAAYLGVSKRWLQTRVTEGMPSRLTGGKRKVQLTKADEWLMKHGHIEEDQ